MKLFMKDPMMVLTPYAPVYCSCPQNSSPEGKLDTAETTHNPSGHLHWTGKTDKQKQTKLFMLGAFDNLTSPNQETSPMTVINSQATCPVHTENSKRQSKWHYLKTPSIKKKCIRKYLTQWSIIRSLSFHVLRPQSSKRQELAALQEPPPPPLSPSPPATPVG